MWKKIRLKTREFLKDLFLLIVDELLRFIPPYLLFIGFVILCTYAKFEQRWLLLCSSAIVSTVFSIGWNTLLDIVVEKILQKLDKKKEERKKL